MTWAPANYDAGQCAGASNTSALAFLCFIAQYFSLSYDSLLITDNTTPGINHDETEFDFIVVGAGSAGCVVANRLSENPNWKVLLLEAGDEEPLVADVPGLSSLLYQTSVDYAYQTQPEPAGVDASYKKPIFYPRGRVMGGTSTINGMWYVRGSRHDYDDWAKQGNEGWSWEEVLPYFKKSEDARDPQILKESPEAHGTGGYLAVGPLPGHYDHVPVFSKAFQQIGLKLADYNSGNNVGIGRTQFMNINGARASSNGAFIRPIRGRRPNLVVRPNSRVTKIIIDSRTKQTKGVEIEISGTAKEIFAKKEVIVSAGVIDSPKLLMISGIGPAGHLKEHGIEVVKDLPVGQNLHDHVIATLPLLFETNGTASFTSSETKQNDAVQWLSTHEGPWARVSVLSVTAFYQTPLEKRPGAADIQYIMAGISKAQNSSDQFSYVSGPYVDDYRISVVNVYPRSRGYLKLNKDDPINGQPQIVMNALTDSDDVKVLVEGMKYAQKLAKAEAFNDSVFKISSRSAPGCEGLDIESDEYFECPIKKNLNLGYHAVGSCKMGPHGNKNSVVDPTLKVIGIKGLRVIDASVMPNIVRGNTHAATVMIAEKGSDMIKASWQ